MWGHSALRLARITRPRTLTMGPSLSPLPHQGRSYHMETICTRKSSHSPADIIRGWQLDSRLIGLLAGSDGVSHLWMCTLRTWRDPRWCSSHPSVVLWSCLRVAERWWWWAWWCDEDEERDLLRQRSVSECVLCVVWACGVCACLWGRFNTEHVEMVYFSLSLGSLHGVRC